MKAIQIRTPAKLDKLELVTMEDPGRPGTGEIRVRLHANSLNYHDYAVANGTIPTADRRIPMSDGAGVVEEVGPNVKEFAQGDQVVSCFFPFWQDGFPPHGNFSHVPGDGLNGFACEIIVCSTNWFTQAPQHFSHLEAATLPCAALTAWRALFVVGKLKPGETVLILGTGGVAIFALQFAKMAGAKVILTSSSDAKLERARMLGADHTINYKSEPKWGDAVRILTDGKGVDHVIEIGGPGTLQQSIAATKVGGHIALIGILTGIAGNVPTLLLMAKQIRLQGLIVGSRAQQMEMIKGLEANPSYRPVIDKTYPLSEISQAFKYQESCGHFGKICLSI